MNDFITLDEALAFISDPDLKNLKELETSIAKPWYFEYFGMHLSEGIIYLTYYYKISGRSIRYKFDITVAGDDYNVVLKRANNHAMNSHDFSACSTILSQFAKAPKIFTAGNLIDLGVYNKIDTVTNMQKVLVP